MDGHDRDESRLLSLLSFSCSSTVQSIFRRSHLDGRRTAIRSAKKWAPYEIIHGSDVGPTWTVGKDSHVLLICKDVLTRLSNRFAIDIKISSKEISKEISQENSQEISQERSQEISQKSVEQRVYYEVTVLQTLQQKYWIFTIKIRNSSTIMILQQNVFF